MSPSCFAPIEDEFTRVLILGSLPSAKSLVRHEYYANPRNAFWRIMESISGTSAADPYLERTAGLIIHGIAIWDVCASANRRDSLDSSIEAGSVVVNDFASFLERHRRIDLICFNGQAAEKFYRRLVLPRLSNDARKIRLELLPSSSPAHTIPLSEKIVAWRDVLEPVMRGVDLRKADSVRE
jgi:TDG/mug DNA glycosylase family protein